MNERDTICRCKSLYIVFFEFMSKIFFEIFLFKHRKYRYNFIIYKLYRENLMWKVEDNYEQQNFLLLNDERKNIKKFFSKWGKARLECVFNIERQNQCGLEK